MTKLSKILLIAKLFFLLPLISFAEGSDTFGEDVHEGFNSIMFFVFGLIIVFVVVWVKNENFRVSIQMFFAGKMVLDSKDSALREMSNTIRLMEKSREEIMANADKFAKAAAFDMALNGDIIIPKMLQAAQPLLSQYAGAEIHTETPLQPLQAHFETPETPVVTDKNTKSVEVNNKALNLVQAYGSPKDGRFLIIKEIATGKTYEKNINEIDRENNDSVKVGPVWVQFCGNNECGKLIICSQISSTCDGNCRTKKFRQKGNNNNNEEQP